MSRAMELEWWRPQAAAGAAWGTDARAGEGSPVPFRALLAFTFILILAPQSHVPALAGARIALVAAGLAIVAHLIDRFLRGQPLLGLGREGGLAAALLGWAAVTIPLSYWPGGSVAFLLGGYLKSLAVFWLLGTCVSSLRRLRVLSWALSLMAVPLAATAIHNYLAGAYAPGGVHRDVKRIVGYEAPLTENPNDLALMLNLLLPLAVALFLAERSALRRMALAAMVALSATAVVITFSRAGFLTLGVIAVLYLWRALRRPERGWAIAALALALLALPLLPAGYLDHLGTIVDIESDPTGSAQARLSGIQAAAGRLLENPLAGAGLGMNVLALNEIRGPAWTGVHNAYLEYGVELGVPGLILFLLLVGSCLASARSVRLRCSRVRSLRDLFLVSEALEIALIAFSVAALFHPVGYHFYFYYVAGMAVAAKSALPASGHAHGDTDEPSQAPAA